MRHALRSILLIVSALAASAPAPARAQATPAHTGTVHTPAVDLAYETLGTSTKQTPIVAINGGPGLTHAYMVQNDLWQRLAQGRQIVFYDQRGNGQSTRLAPDAAQTMDAQIADLEAIRAALHFEKVDLVGDSFGGLVAIAYTLAHPEHVRRLIVSDGLPGWKAIAHPMSDIFPDLEEQAKEQAAHLGKAEAAQFDLRVHMRKCFYSPELAQRYLDNIRDLGYNPAIGEQVGTATEGLDLTPQLAQITAPTLILTGRFDVNVAPLTAWRMYKAIPGAKFHAFEHSGHLPSYEEPNAYLKTVNGFLLAPK